MNNNSGEFIDPLNNDFCPACAKRSQELFEYVRQLENAVVVSRQAIETITLLNEKLTKEKELLLEERRKLRGLVKGDSKRFLQQKKDAIDNAYMRFLNRGNLIKMN